MKTPTEWLNEVGETVMFSAFVGGNPPGKEVEALVKRIQDDAIQEASKPLVEALEKLEKGLVKICKSPPAFARPDASKLLKITESVLKAHRRGHGQEAPILEKPVLPVTKAEVAAWKKETK